MELQGIPVRIEIGPKDVEENALVLVRRDTLEKQFVARDGILETVQNELVKMQSDMLEKARQFRDANMFEVDDFETFKNRVEEGFLLSHWCGSTECETKVKNATKATIRNIPFDQKQEKGRCLVCGAESDGRVIFAKAY